MWAIISERKYAAYFIANYRQTTRSSIAFAWLNNGSQEHTTHLYMKFMWREREKEISTRISEARDTNLFLWCNLHCIVWSSANQNVGRSSLPSKISHSDTKRQMFTFPWRGKWSRVGLAMPVTVEIVGSLKAHFIPHKCVNLMQFD